MLHRFSCRLAAAIVVMAAWASLAADRLAGGKPASDAISATATPGKSVSPQPARIVITLAGQPKKGDAPDLSLAVKVSNPNKGQSLTFLGYKPDSFDPPIPKGQISPIYKIQLKQAGQWQDHPIGWCGTGMGAIPMAPQSEATFGVSVPDGDWQSVRVGVTWTTVSFENAGEKPGDFTTVWSNELTHKEVQQAK
jgi:hypothetical protein